MDSKWSDEVGRLRSGFAPAGREGYESPSAISVEHGGCSEEQRRSPRAVPILSATATRVDPLQAQLRQSATANVQHELLAEMSDVYSGYFASLCAQKCYDEALQGS
jgi:hypothetical protein